MDDPSHYAGAVEHYTSAARRDWVKRAWEEPAFRRHLDVALHRGLALGLRRDLDVLDLGCGTGVALDLLLGVDAVAAGEVRIARYTGLDLDAGLLAVARDRLDGPSGPPAGVGAVDLVVGDLGDPPALGPMDLVLSSGVPLSHLPPEDLGPALTRLVADAVVPGRPALIVVDVLGRWSLEWTTRWDRTRWAYRMSFFASDAAADAVEMTTWDGAELEATVRAAVAAAGRSVLDLARVDRSLAVGRHTSTGEYTPGLPRLRDLVDALAKPGGPAATVAPADLRIEVAIPDAPPEIVAAHRRLAAAWNATLDAADAAGTDGATVAARLRAVEADLEPAGLGLGHSLTLFAVVGDAPPPA
jgi:SAM-dependent methyltransferase